MLKYSLCDNLVIELLFDDILEGRFYCEKIDQAVLSFVNSMEAFASDFNYSSVCAMYILHIGELANNLNRQKYYENSMVIDTWYAESFRP